MPDSDLIHATAPVAAGPNGNGSGNSSHGPSDGVMSLMDAANGATELISADIEALRQVAADRGRRVEERIEAFEDIIDSEVGDTDLVRARNLEREIGLRQIFLKFEGGNPTGTQKDRIAFAQAADAVRRGYDALTVATCGNYGAAIALAASLAGLRAVVHIPMGHHSRRLEEMVARGAEIVRVPGDYEAAVLASQERAEFEELYDASAAGLIALIERHKSRPLPGDRYVAVLTGRKA